MKRITEALLTVSLFAFCASCRSPEENPSSPTPNPLDDPAVSSLIDAAPEFWKEKKHWGSLETGMSKEQVKQILGNPESVTQIWETGELWTYADGSVGFRHDSVIHWDVKYSDLVEALLPMPQPQNYTYITNNGSITITGYTGTGGDITIPDTINGMPVTTIGRGCAYPGAFYACSNITSVIIPEGITLIEGYEFRYCTSLTNIVFPSSVTTIGDAVLSHCANLTSISIGDNVTNNAVFHLLPSLTSIKVNPNNPVYSSLDGVLFNKDQTSLLQYPRGRSNSSYTIPDGVIRIGGEENGLFGEPVFNVCDNLTSIIIPTSLTNTGYRESAFNSCISLKAITVDTNNPAYSSLNGALFNKEQTTLIQYPRGRDGSYTIPPSVITIGDKAFQDCPDLTAVSIPDSVTSIGSFNFKGCPNITTITIPESVNYIGFAAFQSCTNLTEIRFLGNRPRLGKGAFRRASNITFYYTTEAEGWGDTLFDRPTEVWEP